MNRANQLAWAVTEATFTNAPAHLADGSTLTLERVSTVLRDREHAERVAKKHGLVSADALVPVQTLACGSVRNHWTHLQEAQSDH